MECLRANVGGWRKEELQLPGIRKLNGSLYEFYKPTDGQFNIEVIFFHGIQRRGDSSRAHLDTWTSVSSDGSFSFYWPLELLAQEFPSARLLSVLYDAHTTRGPKHGILDLYCIAENLTYDLTNVHRSGCPLILVGQDVGGLVVKAVCIRADREGRRERGRSEICESFLSDVKRILYLCTPHRGFHRVPRRANGAFAKQLGPLDVDTVRLTEEFRDLRGNARCKEWRTMQIATPSTESEFGLSEGTLRDDVDAYYTDWWHDLHTISRPQAPTDPAYDHLSNSIWEFIGRHKSRDELRVPQNSLLYTSGGGVPFVNFQEFSQAEVRIATEDFRRQIGRKQWCPDVFYGRMLDGKEVAVTKLSKSDETLKYFDRDVEVRRLSRVHHRNVVSLVGVCDKRDEKMFIYEFMHNGSLRDRLNGKGAVMDWETRLAVALDAAKGLEYLHYKCNPSIIHLDIKSTNVLLNANMVAKIDDLGISECKLHADDEIDCCAKGTLGYIDPQFLFTGIPSYKSDVFSFGVVLLELITARIAVDVKNLEQDFVKNLVKNLEQGAYLYDYVRKTLFQGNLDAIVDPSLKNNYNSEVIWNLVTLALRCVEREPKNRPNTKEVVQELQGLFEAVRFQGEKKPLPAISCSDNLAEASSTSSFTHGTPRSRLQGMLETVRFEDEEESLPAISWSGNLSEASSTSSTVYGTPRSRFSLDDTLFTSLGTVDNSPEESPPARSLMTWVSF